MAKRKVGNQIVKFDSRPLKVRNHPNILVWSWCATYCWKAFDEGYNFALNLILIEGLHTKLCAPKVIGVPTLRISGLPLGSLGTNDIWVLVPWPSTEYNTRGKVVASPKSRPWWILWVYVYPWFVRAPKCYNYALTNLLFGLCRSVWVIELLVALLSPILELQHGLLPPKCCELGSTPKLLFLPLCSHLDSQLSPSKSLGVHQTRTHTCIVIENPDSIIFIIC